MTTRASHILLVLAAFLTGLVIFLGVFLFATGNLGGGSGAPGASAIGGPFQLIDQDGKPITDADLKGRPFLVFFGYTHCPDVCPATLFEVSELMRALGKDADRAGALFVTLSGGELFLRKDALLVARHARSRGLALRLFTNATRITRELAAEIADVRPLAVEISLYGADARRHDYRLARALWRCRRRLPQESLQQLCLARVWRMHRVNQVQPA